MGVTFNFSSDDRDRIRKLTEAVNRLAIAVEEENETNRKFMEKEGIIEKPSPGYILSDTTDISWDKK